MPRKISVILVMYDLPVKTAAERKETMNFRKYLTHAGFTSVQNSVYAKLVHHKETTQYELQRMQEKLPTEGTVNTLILSLEKFRQMQTMLGKEFNMSMFADDVIVL